MYNLKAGSHKTHKALRPFIHLGPSINPSTHLPFSRFKCVTRIQISLQKAIRFTLLKARAKSHLQEIARLSHSHDASQYTSTLYAPSIAYHMRRLAGNPPVPSPPTFSKDSFEYLLRLWGRFHLKTKRQRYRSRAALYACFPEFDHTQIHCNPNLLRFLFYHLYMFANY